MKNRQIILLCVFGALLCSCGGLLSGFVIGYKVSNLSNRAPVVQVPARYVEVVVAAQYIPKETVIQKSMLTTIHVPESATLEGEFLDLNKVVGCHAKSDIAQGVPITDVMVVAPPQP